LHARATPSRVGNIRQIGIAIARNDQVADTGILHANLRLSQPRQGVDQIHHIFAIVETSAIDGKDRAVRVYDRATDYRFGSPSTSGTPVELGTAGTMFVTPDHKPGPPAPARSFGHSSRFPCPGVSQLDNSSYQGYIKGDDNYSRHQQHARRVEAGIWQAWVMGLAVPINETVPAPSYHGINNNGDDPCTPTHWRRLCARYRTTGAHSL